MRIAIVNDSIIATEAMRRVLLTVDEHQVIWMAKNGAEAVAKCAQNSPDLVLMDLLMPVLDGVEATRQIMQRSPCAILIVTVDVKQNAAKVYEAMSYGALDAVNTPVLGSYGSPEVTQTLLRKITTIEKLIRKPARPPSAFPPPGFPAPTASLLPPFVAIGASTGGPKALATILAPLPKDFRAAIVIVQHVDAQFAPGLIEWLDHQTALSVKKAEVGDRMERGKVFVAATDDHLTMQIDRTLAYVKEPIHYPYRPSVDVFFKSIAQSWNARGIAVLLTGMGRDGAEGLSLLKQRGWQTIAQDQASCVVYGMPKAAAELNAATDIMNPEAIASTLLHSITQH